MSFENCKIKDIISCAKVNSLCVNNEYYFFIGVRYCYITRDIQKIAN